MHMKTILVINDRSPAAEHALKLALNIAEKMKSNILLANTRYVGSSFAQPSLAGPGLEFSEDDTNDTLKEIKQTLPGPEIIETDISSMDENQLAQMIHKNEIDLLVKGMPEKSPKNNSGPNIHHLLNKVLCPLMLVPECWQLKNIERLVHIEDLRFCRTRMVSYLAAMAEAFGGSLSVAHLSANGIPDMEAQYAERVFRKEIYDRLTFKNIFFNNIKEKDIKKAIDIIINDMHNDVLAFVNRRFHFEEIMGRYLTDVLPPHITVPLLIFPY